MDQAGYATLRRRPALSTQIVKSSSLFVPTGSSRFKSRRIQNRKIKNTLEGCVLIFHGGPGGIWTRDQKIKSLLLYQLSYRSRYIGTTRTDMDCDRAMSDSKRSQSYKITYFSSQRLIPKLGEWNIANYHQKANSFVEIQQRVYVNRYFRMIYLRYARSKRRNTANRMRRTGVRSLCLVSVFDSVVVGSVAAISDNALTSPSLSSAWKYWPPVCLARLPIIVSSRSLLSRPPLPSEKYCRCP